MEICARNLVIEPAVLIFILFCDCMAVISVFSHGLFSLEHLNSPDQPIRVRYRYPELLVFYELLIGGLPLAIHEFEV